MRGRLKRPHYHNVRAKVADGQWLGCRTQPSIFVSLCSKLERNKKEKIMSKLLFSFEGRINRKPFWMFLLIVLIGTIITTFIDMATTGQDSGIASLLFILVIFWPSLAIQVTLNNALLCRVRQDECFF
jgi:hypothetical protein